MVFMPSIFLYVQVCATVSLYIYMCVCVEGGQNLSLCVGLKVQFFNNNASKEKKAWGKAP